MNVHIRPATHEDRDSIWAIIQPVIQAGNTYTFDPESSREDMLGYWCARDKHTYVAEYDGRITGTFILKDNQPGLGNHVANASYMTHPEAEGQGIGTKMAMFSINEARRLGYQAIQFNIVIKTNTRAIGLWKKLGFIVIGEIPKAFRHPEFGLTNALIMWREL